MQRFIGLAAGLAMGLACAAAAQGAAGAGGGNAVLPGGSGREPVSIDAAKLDYFDKEQKLVYSGDVVAKQGTSTLKGAVLTIFLAKQAAKAEGEGGSSSPAPEPGGGSIRRMEVAGPVTVIQKDEVGTGDSGSYDKAANTMTLTGHVTLTQATNIVKGDRLVYDMTTGRAQVWSGQTSGRVTSVFTPKSSGQDPAAAPAAAAASPRKAGTRPVKTP